jgi:hypothetical protein
VYAGGTLSNNTYKWFKDGSLVATRQGDSTFTPTQGGAYTVEVTNAVAWQLTLHSDTITINTATGFKQNDIALIQDAGKVNFSIYPNPAKDILHVETNSTASFSLLNQSGKILITTDINKAGSINVSNIAAGIYYLRNNNTKVVTKIFIVK